jgi:hypothetical protein
MSSGTSKPRVWSEFAGGMGRWDVCLNNYGFEHAGLLQDYARAYHKAAKRLFEEFSQTLCAEDRFGDHRDMDASPIAFLYRHALEVYLKMVIVFGRPLLCLRGKPLKRKEDVLPGHGLLTLLTGVEEIFDLIDCSDFWNSSLCGSFSDVERVVKAVEHVTHDSLRYPVRIRKGELEDLLPGGLRFNVRTFAEKMDALLDVLDAAAVKADDVFQTETFPAIRRS